MSQLKLDGYHDINTMIKEWCKKELTHHGHEDIWIDTTYDTKNDAFYNNSNLHNNLNIGVFKTFMKGFLNVYTFKYKHEYMRSRSENTSKDDYEYTTLDVNIVVNKEIVEKCRSD